MIQWVHTRRYVLFVVLPMMLSIPDLVLPKTRHFGLSIDTNSLRVVELGKENEIRHIAEIVLPDDVFSEGILKQPAILGESVRKLITAANIDTPYVAVCFPEAFAFTRGLSLPVIPMDEVGEAVLWRARDLFPFPVEEIYFDWKLLSKTETEYKLSVVAVQKKIIDPLISVLVEVGLRPLSFEPDASAIARLLVLSPDQHMLVADINKRVAYVTLVEGQKALFTTVVTYPVEGGVSKYIANLNQTIAEIDSYYKRKGIIHEDVIHVILTGEVASEEWLKQIPYPSKLLITKVSNTGFNKSYAAAIAKIAPPTDPDSINLLPALTQTYYDTERKNTYYKVLLTRILVFVGILAGISVAVYVSVLLEHQRLDTEVKRLTSLNQSQTTGSQGLLRLNAEAKTIVALAALRKTQKDNITLLASLVPSNITLIEFEYDDSKLLFTISGIATTREALLEFKENIETSDAFGKVSIPLGILEVPINVKFTLSFVATK